MYELIVTKFDPDQTYHNCTTTNFSSKTSIDGFLSSKIVKDSGGMLMVTLLELIPVSSRYHKTYICSFISQSLSAIACMYKNIYNRWYDLFFRPTYRHFNCGMSESRNIYFSFSPFFHSGHTLCKLMDFFCSIFFWL